MLTLRVPASSVEEISDRIWTQPGILGVQESPLGGAMFAVREDFEILEFGSEAARKCADWLEAESFRQGAELLLKVYLDPPESFDPKTFLKEVDEEGKSKVEGFVLLEEEDYLANYKKSVPGTSFGKNFWIGPPWADQPADRKCFVVEPGLAFGTGGHPTTQLCFERLAELSEKEPGWKSFLDLGTGSGILGVGVRTFFPKAELIVSDLDPLCAAEVDKTFALNGMESQIPQGFFGAHGSAAALLRDGFQFDVIVSNIYAEILAQIAPEVTKLLRPGGRWIMSGILRSPAEQHMLDAVAASFTRVWEDSRTVETPRLDSEGGLKAIQETWVAYDFRKHS